MLFADRTDAGRRLAERLRGFLGKDVVVLGLPRGGVPVAFEVARALGAPLDVIVVRKLGVPYQPELGMGAIGEGGVRVLNEVVLRLAGVSEQELVRVEERERAELDRRVHRFRGDRPAVPVAGRTALIVDDGVATGSTARAACQVARVQGATRVVLAVPVAPAGIESALAPDADEVVCLHSPASFAAIGAFYDDFTQTTDAQVAALLAQAAAPAPERVTAGAPGSDPPGMAEEVGARLAHVQAPTLLIVGGADAYVLELNRQARAQLRCPSRLAVVPGATHLFEEPGALEAVAQLARDWFTTHLSPVGAITG